LHSELQQRLLDLLLLQVVQQWVLKALLGFLYIAQVVLKTGLDGFTELFKHLPIKVSLVGHL
jgi:hypothetical protein